MATMSQTIRGDLVSTGPPEIYTLKKNVSITNEEQRIAKCVIGGELNIYSENKVIMVIGETGSGKTTLINAMINYITGVEWTDKFRYKLIIEDESKSQAESHTDWITCYTMCHNDAYKVDYSVTIVDTPGFADTRGSDRDAQIIEQIKEFFETNKVNGIDHIDAIGFVACSGRPRLTEHQKYIFDRVFSIFGKDIKNNIFLLITFADNQKPAILSSIEEAGVKYNEHFSFNNLAFWACPDEKDEFNLLYWNMGVKGFQKFFECVDNVEKKSLVWSKEVLVEREKIRIYLDFMKDEIRACLNACDARRREQALFEKYETDIENYKKFEVVITEVITERKSCTGNNTNCPKCQVTCHEKCSKFLSAYWCTAMNIVGNCIVCKCPCEDHSYERFKFTKKNVSVVKTSDDVKKRYEDAVKESLSAKEIIDKCHTDFETSHKNLLDHIEIANKSILRLQEIALVTDAPSITSYIDLFIADEKYKEQFGWQERVDQLSVIRKICEFMGNPDKRPRASAGRKIISVFKEMCHKVG